MIYKVISLFLELGTRTGTHISLAGTLLPYLQIGLAKPLPGEARPCPLGTPGAGMYY